MFKYVFFWYSLLVWLFVFIVIRWKRVKLLWPVGVLSGLILFVTQQVLLYLQLYRFNWGLAIFLGVPLSHILWGIASGIVFIYYLPATFTRRVCAIILFAVLVLGFEYIAEQVGIVSHLYTFNELIEFLIDIVILVLITFVSDGLWSKRIQKAKELW
jgi:hypothetical protein